MAQLIVPINSYTNGSALSTGDWTNPITRAGTTLTVQGTAPNKSLALFANVAGTKVFGYVPVANVDDIEILTKFRLSSDFGKQGVVALRYTGNSEATTAGYIASGSFISSAGRLALDEGQTGYLYWSAWNYLPNIDYWVRMRVNGNTISAKVWTDGSTEPGSWTVSGTDSHQTTGDFSGLQTYSLASGGGSATVTYKFISFGTNGDSAPGPTLVMSDAQHTHALDAVILTQKHTLEVNDLSHGHALDDAGDLIHNIALAVEDLQHGHTLDSPEVLPEGIVFPEDLQHGHSLDSVVLSQKHTLAIDDLSHGHVLEAVSTVSGTTLSVNDLLHANTLDQANIVQDHLLAVSDVSHAHALEEASLQQKHLLGVQDVSHAQLLDALILEIPPTLGPPPWPGVDIQRPTPQVREPKAHINNRPIIPRIELDGGVSSEGADDGTLVDDPEALVDDPVALVGRYIDFSSRPFAADLQNATVRIDTNNTKAKGVTWPTSPQIFPPSSTSTPIIHSRKTTTVLDITRSTPKLRQSPPEWAPPDL